MNPGGPHLLHTEVAGPGDGTADGPSIDRTPVLLLHGFTGSMTNMAGIGRPLSESRWTIAVDLPGHGRTGAFDEAHRYGFDHTVDAVADVLERLDAEPAHVVGYSMGGRIALGLAVRHPDVVASLVLIGASPGLADPVERSARRRSDDELADDLEEKGLEWFVDHWMASPLFASQERLGRDALVDARAQRLTNDPEGLAGSLRGAGTGAQPSHWHDLPRIAAPTLLMVGDEDSKFRAIALRMGAGLPRSTMEVVPDAGHAAHLENPGHVVASVREFLDDIDRQAGR